MTTRRTFLKAAALGAATTPLWLQQALASTFEKAAHLIVPFPAGGGTDVVARMIANQLQNHYPRGLVIENKAGASGRLGPDTLLTSAPDGATMLMVPDFVMTIFPHIFHNLRYNPLQDFTPVSMVTKTNYAFSAGPGLPEQITTLEQFVDWAKANPDRAAFASTAAGAATHFIGLMLSKAIGVDLLHVPYKGGAQALQDLMAGQIPVGVNPIGEVLPQVNGGRVRILATTGATRSRFVPDVPTLVELGLPEMDIESWVGVFMPKGTAPATVNEVSGWFNTALQRSDLQESLAQSAMEPVQSTPANFASTLEADIAKWGPVIEASGFKADT